MTGSRPSIHPTSSHRGGGAQGRVARGRGACSSCRLVFMYISLFGSQVHLAHQRAQFMHLALEPSDGIQNLRLKMRVGDSPDVCLRRRRRAGPSSSKVSAVLRAASE